MVRPTMHHPDPQVQQPDGQGCKGVGTVMAPRRAIVHQHGGGQAVVPEDGGEVALNGLPLLIAAGPHAEREPGVVIQHRQGVTAPTTADGEMALEVQLPQIVRVGVLEALVGLALGRSPRGRSGRGAGGWR